MVDRRAVMFVQFFEVFDKIMNPLGVKVLPASLDLTRLFVDCRLSLPFE